MTGPLTTNALAFIFKHFCEHIFIDIEDAITVCHEILTLKIVQFVQQLLIITL